MSTITEKVQILEEKLRQAGDPVSRVDLLNQLAYELRHTDTSLSLQRSREAIALAQKATYLKGLAKAYLNQGFVENVLANYNEALKILNQANQIFEDLQDEPGLAQALYNLSLVYRNLGDYEQALESCERSMALRQLTNDLEGQGACLMQLGYINGQFGKYDEAYKNYTRSLAIRQEINDHAGSATVLLGMAIIEQKWQQYTQAEAHFLECLAIREEEGEMHGWLITMNYLGELYLELKKLSQAETTLSEALARAKQQAKPFPANFCRLYTSMAKVYIAQQKYQEALVYLERALTTAKEANMKYLIYDIYFTLSEVYKLIGNYQQALISYEQFHLIKEEVINLSASTKLKNMELANQIEAEKVAAEIHRLRHIELKEAYDKLQTTQQQLIQTEKMASLGELTAGIAHEIQNPLNFVNNFSEVSLELLTELKEAHEKEERDFVYEAEMFADLEMNLAKIQQHGRRADSIVKKMLEHSQAAGGEKQLVNLNALADEYLRLSYHSFRANDKNFNPTLLIQFDEHLGEVKVVTQEIGRVLLNLFNNAFYAMQEKQKQAGNHYQPELKVSTSLQDKVIQIKVRDNGCGIPDKVKNKIFQPFFTTKPSGQGIGLGLSLSYDIITNGHGGELMVASGEGTFTEFTLQLPQ